MQVDDATPSEAEPPIYMPPTSMADYWREAIGTTYRPVKWNPRWADHPLRVKEVIARLKAGEPCPEAADVIVGLVHSMCVSENLQAELSRLVIEATEADQARVAPGDEGSAVE